MSNYVETTRVKSGEKIPVAYWAAAIGALLLAFEIYLLVKWVSGPNFARIPYGPSEPPQWMKLSIDICQPFSIVATIYGMWLYIGRPWVRDKRVTVWGLLLISLVLTSVYDPFSNYYHNWIGYNSYFLSYGSPLPGGLPGWQSYAEPGAMTAWPIIFMPTLYPFLMLVPAWACMRSMQALRDRYPRAHWSVLVVCGLITAMILDIVLEGEMFMRLGWYAEAGWALNQGEYYQLPFHNIVGAMFIFAALGCLVYFRNDQGQTFCERGVERLQKNSAMQIGVRFLAVLAALQLIMAVCYYFPVALFQKYYPSHWPESISSQSYWNNHMCGPQTPRPCL